MLTINFQLDQLESLPAWTMFRHGVSRASRAASCGLRTQPAAGPKGGKRKREKNRPWKNKSNVQSYSFLHPSNSPTLNKQRNEHTASENQRFVHTDVKSCTSRDQATSITVRHCPIWRLNLLLWSQQHAKTVKLFEDSYSRFPLGTWLSRTSAKVHMAWSCKYFAFCILCYGSSLQVLKTVHAHGNTILSTLLSHPGASLQIKLHVRERAIWIGSWRTRK